MKHYTLSRLLPGITEAFTHTVTEADMDLFYRLTGDDSPIHRSDGYAESRGFSGRVVYGMLCAGFVSTLAGVYLPGEHCLLHSLEVTFAKPVYLGNELTVRGTVTEVNETFRQITVKFSISNEAGVRVCRGSYKAGLAR